MSGTYLPSFGVPVTLGYPILREGYSGYAVAYGVVIPAALLLLLKKKYLWAVVSLVPCVTLVRIDRVFFALTSPLESVAAVNTAGKIVGLYALAIVAAALLKTIGGAKIKWKAVLVPSVFVAYVSEKHKNCLKEKHENIWYSLGIAVVILSAVNFEPYDDAQTYFVRNEEEAHVQAVLEQVDGIVWAPVEFVSVARRLDGNFESLFGRDTNDPKMAGFNYEDDYGMAGDYKNGIYNVATGKYFYVTKIDTRNLVEFAVIAGAKYAVLPTEDGYTVKRMHELR
ncbi:MAG: hypothetical protein J6X08_00865 [Lachnospiraceae bacterium]|nr:hypothetical protein [Lachnospiraceae bacterium]